ncbi:hypothetical protein M0R45_011449 [Rubus argutus]|uniref:Uncharacterized protein n=1 Tax=Rubus argutus TaxID=59490 RepID=A0AAW1Y9X8_RUBAR
MASVANSLIVIVLFSLISQGLCVICTNNDIKIVTTGSGRVVQGKPEWNVVVTNSCKCPQAKIKVNIKAFQSVEPVNSSILSQLDVITYMLINGDTLAPGASVKFSYAWDFAFRIFPADSLSIPC